jgi:hypothetical protein
MDNPSKTKLRLKQTNDCSKLEKLHRRVCGRLLSFKVATAHSGMAMSNPEHLAFERGDCAEVDRTRYPHFGPPRNYSRLVGSWPETGFEEITGHVPERDFWPDITTEDGPLSAQNWRQAR